MNDDPPPSPLPHFREAFFRRLRSSVPATRQFTAHAVDAWGLAARRDDILLCVTELATNALLHGVPPGRGYRLRLRLTPAGLLRAELHDSGPGMADVREGRGGAEDETGRGLLLVGALADAWGVAFRDPGKIVWCEFTPR